MLVDAHQLDPGVTTPRHDVRVVGVERYEHEVAWREPEARGQKVQPGGGAGEEHDLVARRAQELRDLRTGALVRIRGLLREVVLAAVNVCADAREVVHDGVDHGPGFEGGRGAVEVDDRVAVDPSVQQREVGPDRLGTARRAHDTRSPSLSSADVYEANFPDRSPAM